MKPHECFLQTIGRQAEYALIFLRRNRTLKRLEFSISILECPCKVVSYTPISPPTPYHHA